MDKCPKCNQLVGDGLGVHYNSDIVRNGLDTIRRLRRQLAQRDSRIAELEATIDEWEQKAANWMASPEAQKQLDGYRELSMRAMRAEDETGDLRAKIAELEAKLAAAARLAQDSADAAGEMAQCHGQVVPVELVEAIDLAFDGSNAHSDQWITNVRAAIKAAIGGAM